MHPDRHSPQAAGSPEARHIAARLPISRELETKSPGDFFSDLRRQADDIRAQWAAEDDEENSSQV